MFGSDLNEKILTALFDITVYLEIKEIGLKEGFYLT
jgi:hypothetical protein